MNSKLLDMVMKMNWDKIRKGYSHITCFSSFCLSVHSVCLLMVCGMGISVCVVCTARVCGVCMDGVWCAVVGVYVVCMHGV